MVKQSEDKMKEQLAQNPVKKYNITWDFTSFSVAETAFTDTIIKTLGLTADMMLILKNLLSAEDGFYLCRALQKIDRDILYFSYGDGYTMTSQINGNMIINDSLIINDKEKQVTIAEFPNVVDHFINAAHYYTVH